MARTRRTAHELLAGKVASVPAILPTGVYRVGELPALLRIGRDSVEEEIRSGRLRSKRAAGKILILGQWLIRWLRTEVE